MYFAKQVNPEFAEDDLFYRWTDEKKHSHVGINDDYIAENIIIDGNKDYLSFTNSAYDAIKRLDLYEFDNINCYWAGCYGDYLNYYVPKTNGKKYSNKEIHAWKEMLNKGDVDVCLALKLITGKTWREISLRGCAQSEWQEGYATNELTSKDIEYVEMCYFNTGREYIVYESEEDYESEENGCSYYVSSWKSKEELEDRLCGEVRMFDFDGYIKIPQYKEV